MSKAEDRARECFPNEDSNSLKAKFGFLLGYHQAEEDLKLTWEDISTLRVILDDVELEFRKGLHEDKDYIGYCKEVLNRFNKYKER